MRPFFWRQTKKFELNFGNGGRDGNRLGRLAPVGSRFFDWPVVPVKKPVKFLFLAAKIHLNTKRNIHTDICFLDS